MEYTYQPLSNNLQMAMLWLVAAIMLGVISFFIYKNKRQVLSMFLFFLASISLCSAIFTAWLSFKIVPVQLNQEFIQTSYGKTKLTDIRSAHLEENPQNVTFLNNQRTKLLVIQSDSQVHVLSELDYPIHDIKQQLDTLMVTLK